MLPEPDNLDGMTVSVSQAAAMMRPPVTEIRILQLIKAGELRAHKEKRFKRDKCGKWVIAADDVAAYDLARKRTAALLSQVRRDWARRQKEKRLVRAGAGHTRDLYMV